MLKSISPAYIEKQDTVKSEELEMSLSLKHKQVMDGDDNLEKK